MARERVCKNEFFRHRWGEDGVCTRCGAHREERATGERAPRRGGARSSVTRKQLQESIALLIGGAQMIACGMAPELQEDALNMREIAMLSDALAGELDSFPQAKKWIAKVQGQSAHAKLLLTIVMIAAPRLARRGLIPEGIDDVVSASLAMESGPAPSGDRGNGIGEVVADGEGSEYATVLRGDPDEAGRRDLPGTDHHENGADPERPKVRSHRTRAAATAGEAAAGD